MADFAGRTLGRALVVIKGAGDMASGVAHRLWQCGFSVVMTELSDPVCVRRPVCFAEAIALGSHSVESVTAVRAASLDDVAVALRERKVPVVVDPEGAMIPLLGADVVVDAIMGKRNTGTQMADAPLVVGLGPGFTAGKDCHAVVETMRGHHLGRTLYAGSAADAGSPGEIAVIADDRVLRAPVSGRFQSLCEIGGRVVRRELIGWVQPGLSEPRIPVIVRCSGVIRGLIRHGTPVSAQLKIGDVDPTGDVSRCHTISDKARAVGGGVLEAVLNYEARGGKFSWQKSRSS